MTSSPGPTNALRLGTAKSGEPMKTIRIGPPSRESAPNWLPRGQSGQSGNRSIEPGAGAAAGSRSEVGEARGAAPGEAARDGAEAAAVGAAAGRRQAVDQHDLRQCRYVRSLLDLQRP